MDRGERAIKFISKLKHSKDKWAGKPVKLEQWQQDYIRKLFGTVNADGLRQYRTSLLFLPRKNGKSFIAACIVLLCLVTGGEGQEIYSAASDREQACVVFNEVVNIIRQDKTLSRLLVIRESRKAIYYRDKRSIYRALSADAGTKHGFNASVVIADELHTWKTRELWDVLTTSQAARSEPLTLAITTAGFDRQSICFEVYDYAKRVAVNPAIDSTFLPVIYEMPEGADFESEETWRVANPNYGISINKEYFAQQLTKIKETPSYLDTFLRLHLNVWTQAENRWLPQDAWDQCGKLTFDVEQLRGRQCFAGLDLAATSDICAFVLVFPLDDGRYVVLCEFWCPGDNAKLRETRDRVPYMSWSHAGHIHLTNGNVVDYQAIRQRINELGQQYQITEIAVDMNWQGVQTAQQLEQDGFKIIGFGQGWRSMAAPVLEIEKLVLSNNLLHLNNPVLNWHAGNVVTVCDDAGNQKFSKERSREKIDGMVALAMGLGRAIVNDQNNVLLTVPLFIGVKGSNPR